MIAVYKLKETDIDKVIALINDEVGTRLSLSDEDIRQHIDNYWVAKINNEVVGVIGLEHSTDTIVKVLVVKLGYWRLGIGTSLLITALEQFKGIHHTIVVNAWDLDVGGTPRIDKLLTKQGFKLESIKEKHYMDIDITKCQRHLATNKHCGRCSLYRYIRERGD